MSQRKLLQEIDKVFKKVKEGLEIFDGYYDKLMSCESQSQKEKLEGDLKREIKKLQRQRDQIKNWLSGNEVKDKKQLLENRKLIENAMERFKVVEKNMKTKAFSKEGLSMERIDPKEKEKNETSEFLHQMLEELERQCEKHEATIDQIQSSGKKGKKLDIAKQNEINELQEKLERHHWHEEKLEQILRFLANDDLECEQVNNLQEEIKYYVESNEDADFMEDETVYDELGLEDAEEAYGNIGDYPQVNNAQEEEEEDNQNNDSTLNNTPKKASVSSLTTASNQSQPTPSPINKIESSNISTTNTTSSQWKQPISTPQVSTPVLSTASIGLANLKPSVAPKAVLNYSSIVNAGINTSSVNTSSATLATTSIDANENAANASNATATPSPVQTSAKINQVSSSITASENFKESSQSPRIEVVQLANNTSQDVVNEHIEPSLLLADLIPSFEQLKQHISKPVPFEDISKVLETSLLNCPDSLDAEKPKLYDPVTPHPTSIHYPQEPTPELSYPSILGKLDLSTLFFNFYYRQGEYIQLLSAQELVKKGWKFDKISSKWFQKIEEIQPPSIVNDNVISTEKKISWKFFDNEGVWLPRRKDDFDIEAVDLVTSF